MSRFLIPSWLLSIGCAQVDLFHEAVLPAQDLQAVEVDIERGSFVWVGDPVSETLDVEVHSWAGGAGAKRAGVNEETNDWGALVTEGVASLWAATPSRRAGVDFGVSGPDQVDIDALVREGTVWLSEVEGSHVVTADAITARPVAGSVDLFAVRGGIDADVRPEDGDTIRLEAYGGDVFLGLPYGIDVFIEVIGDPTWGMDVADLGYDSYFVDSGYFTASTGEGRVVVQVVVDDGAFVLYEAAAP